MPKVLLASVSTANAYVAKCIVSLVSIHHLNPQCDMALFLDGSLPPEFREDVKRLNIQVHTLRADENFRNIGLKNYPLVCVNIFQVYKHVADYDFVITVDGDMTGLQPIPESLYTRPFAVSGYGVKRKWSKKTLQSGILCFNVRKCLAIGFYEQLLAYYRKYNHLNRWNGDDFLLGWFVHDTKASIPYHFSSWQYIPCFSFSKPQGAYVLHLVDKFHPWHEKCLFKVSAKMHPPAVCRGVREWIRTAQHIFGPRLKTLIPACHKWFYHNSYYSKKNPIHKTPSVVKKNAKHKLIKRIQRHRVRRKK